jgi:hypothetical protein
LLDAVSISGERPQGQGIDCLRAPNTNSEDRNFSVVELHNISGQTVFKKGDFTVPLDFAAARRNFLRRSGLTAKDFPHNHWMRPHRL